MKDDILEVAKRRFDLVTQAEEAQRRRENEDVDFLIPENQWTPEAKELRAGSPETPARPMLSINKVSAPIRLLSAQAQQARLGVEIHPISENADDDTAEILQGTYRRIERDSSAEQARLWAFSRALSAGRGYYRVVTDYDEDAGDTFDQEIRIERILHQDGVYLDPSATKPDWSDGEFAFITAWIPEDTFKQRYPKSKIAMSAESQWEGMRQSAPEWVRVQDGKNAALVAEYWWKEHEITEVIVEADGEAMRRERDIVTVHTCKITGDEILEEPSLWNGRLIPIIPVIGEEQQPVNGERRFTGIVHDLKDGQRFYNMAASTLVERLGLEPKAPFVGYTGQFEGHEEKWDSANIRNWSYLEVNPVSTEGQGPLPLPQRATIDGSGMNLALMALQEADQFIQASSGVFDPSLGRVGQGSNKERSGRAVLALQQQTEISTSGYLYNLAQVAMAYEARVILDLIPHIYDRPGRITQILGEEGDTSPIMWGQPFITHQKTGRPQPVPETHPGAKFYDPKNARYGVSVSIGKSQQTRLAEGSEMIGEIISKQPQLMPILGPVFFRFQDWPGAKEIAKDMQTMREHQFPFLDHDDQGFSPEKAQAQIQGMGQQMQMLQQQLQAAMQQIQTDQAKQQAQILKAQLDAKTSTQKAELDAQTRLAIEDKKSQTAIILAELTNRFDALQAALAHQQEAKLQASQQMHEAAMGEDEQAHERGMEGIEMAKPIRPIPDA